MSPKTEEEFHAILLTSFPGTTCANDGEVCVCVCKVTYTYIVHRIEKVSISGVLLPHSVQKGRLIGNIFANTWKRGTLVVANAKYQQPVQVPARLIEGPRAPMRAPKIHCT